MWSVTEWMPERNPQCGTCQTRLSRKCGWGSEETLSYAGYHMFKIGPFHVLKHPLSQESVAVASCFVISRMHWCHFWKQILLHLFLMVLSGQRRLIISQDLSWESVCHNFSGSVFSQRGIDLKNLLSQVLWKVVNTSVKSGTTLKKKRCKNVPEYTSSCDS